MYRFVNSRAYGFLESKLFPIEAPGSIAPRRVCGRFAIILLIAALYALAYWILFGWWPGIAIMSICSCLMAHVISLVMRYDERALRPLVTPESPVPAETAWITIGLGIFMLGVICWTAARVIAGQPIFG